MSTLLPTDLPLVAAAYLRVLRHVREDIEIDLMRAYRARESLPFLERALAEVQVLQRREETEGDTMELRELSESWVRRMTAAGYGA